MAVSKDFLIYIIDELSRVQTVTSKRMFGAAGLYAEGFFFALIDNDILYFKVDDSNRADYESYGMEIFKPFPDKESTMPYYEVPADVLEDIDLLKIWLNKSLLVAKKAKTKKKK